MEDVVSNLAKNVRLARQKLGLSQEQLADEAGIDRTYVSGIERGLRNPSIQIVAKLASVLKVAAGDLLLK